jgi:tetratricopeptide (TPR) repeat protein
MMETLSGHFSSFEGHFNVPNRACRQFVGRDNVLDNCFDFHSGKCTTSKVVVLRGLGGQGKTQVALEYCQRRRQAPFVTTFWIDATTELSVEREFRRFYTRFRSREDTPLDSFDDIVNFVSDTFQRITKPWLIVFDNYDDPSSMPNIRKFIPSSSNGSVLITTRHADVLALANSGSIELQPLAKAESIQLLLASADLDPQDVPEALADHIATGLHNHALAIAQAGEYIKRRKISLAEFIGEYDHLHRAMSENHLPLSEYQSTLNEAQEATSLSVFTSWELSIRLLKATEESKGLKEDLLTILGFSQTLDVSEQMLKVFCENMQPWDSPEAMRGSPGAFLAAYLGAWNTGIFGELLAEFSDLFLIQGYYRGNDGFYHARLHPLAKDWIVLRTSKEKSWDYRILAVDIFVEAINPSIVRDDQTNVAPAGLDCSPDIGAASLEHVERNLEGNLTPNSQQLRTLLESQITFANMLERNGEYRRAEWISRRLVRLSEKCCGPTDLHTMETQHLLAGILIVKMQYLEAESIYSRIAHLAIRMQGFDSNLSKDITRTWAFALMSLKRYDEAMSLLQQVSESETKLSGRMGLYTAIQLARLVRFQGRYYEALEMCDNALSLAVGNMAPGTLHALTLCRAESVYCYIGLGDWEHAAKAGELLWPEQVMLLGDQHPDTNTTLIYLAQALGKLGDFEKAERLQRKAYENFLLTLGSDHLTFSVIQSNLGWTLWCQGRLDEAESYYRSAIDGLIRKKQLPSETDVSTVLGALACVLRDGGAAHVARYEIAKYISSLEEQDIESQAPFCDRVENLAQGFFSMDMKKF